MVMLPEVQYPTLTLYPLLWRGMIFILTPSCWGMCHMEGFLLKLHLVIYHYGQVLLEPVFKHQQGLEVLKTLN